MNILHLFSDWKWTGPAEPVLNSCMQLEKRGHKVFFAYRKPPVVQPRCIEFFVRERGARATDQFRLNRYFSITDNPVDVVNLRRFIRSEQIDVVNTHLSHDHLLGLLGTRLASKRVALIRTDHLRESFRYSLANKLLLRTLTDGIITFSEKARQNLTARFAVPAERVVRVDPAVDSSRFDARIAERSLREVWNASADDVLVGVVARFQKYRRMDLFFDAFARAVKRAPCLKAVLIGRSSQIRETVHRPIQELGLEKHAVLAGYLEDNYVNGLASLDVFVFMIAGSDGTGRAMREAMAMGLPVLANNIGMLPEMIDAGVDGLVFNNAEELAEQMVGLASDYKRRAAMGAAGAAKARTRFSLEHQTQEIERFYERILALKRQ